MAATHFIAPVILLCLAIFLHYKISPLSKELPVASCNLQWGLLTLRNAQLNLSGEAFLRNNIRHEKKDSNMVPYRLSLRFLAGILLACGNISTNPGPSSRFNCGLCDHRVTWRDQGVCCDKCGIWYHVACQSIGRSTLSALNSSGVSWVCCSCNCPNYSAIYFYRSTDLSNAFEALSTSGSTSEQRSIASPIPLATSSPNYECTSQMSNKSSCRPIRLLNLNARSLNKKKVDFCNLVESTQPDVIVLYGVMAYQ